MSCAVKREMAEQQLRARQMVLQQQAASAVAAASKTQREVRPACLNAESVPVLPSHVLSSMSAHLGAAA